MEKVCLYDSYNTIVFPIEKDELELLFNDVNRFEEYINLTYNGVETKNSNFLALAKSCSHENTINSLWLVVSAKDKTIIGHFSFCKKNAQYQLKFDINKIYNNYQSHLFAEALVINWIKENNLQIELINSLEFEQL